MLIFNGIFFVFLYFFLFIGLGRPNIHFPYRANSFKIVLQYLEETRHIASKYFGAR